LLSEATTALAPTKSFDHWGGQPSRRKLLVCLIGSGSSVCGPEGHHVGSRHNWVRARWAVAQRQFVVLRKCATIVYGIVVYGIVVYGIVVYGKINSTIKTQSKEW